MQPIPRQVDVASPSQLSTGTPPKTRKRTEYIMRESRIDLQTEISPRTNQSRQEAGSIMLPTPKSADKTLTLGLVKGIGRGKPIQGNTKIKVLVSDNGKPVVPTKAE